MGDEVEKRKMMLREVAEITIDIPAETLSLLDPDLAVLGGSTLALPIKFRVEVDPDRSVPLQDALVLMIPNLSTKEHPHPASGTNRYWTKVVSDVALHVPVLKDELSLIYPDRAAEIKSWR